MHVGNLPFVIDQQYLWRVMEDAFGKVVNVSVRSHCWYTTTSCRRTTTV